jgi:hypothetical protein
MTPSNPLALLSVAAPAVLGNLEYARPKTYATWQETRRDDYFEPHATISSLRLKGYAVDDELLIAYASIHQQHSPLSLANINRFLPGLTSVNSPLVGYQSLAPPQAEARFIAIFTFTTPAFSRDGKSAFLEVWTEDGQYARMGPWWWLQMRLSPAGWTVDWKYLHTMS